ncbi:MAG: CRISPR-associated endonuclease Cas2 [Deltaproteobacteria bacterium]|nr:CRISPR-associated endonuclease Cas2 [Deltaproteobacteria bacterium]
MFCVISFDISDDKIRYRVVKELKGVAVRVQKSVFECADLRESRFIELKKKLEKTIDKSEDTVRYYFLCKGCVPRVEYSGIGGEPVRDEGFKVI